MFASVSILSRLSRLRDRFLFSPLRYLNALIFGLFPLLGYWLDALWLSLLVTFALTPLLDMLVGTWNENPSPEQEAAMRSNRWFDLVSLLYVPMHLGQIAWGAWVVTTGGLSLLDQCLLTVSIGLTTGAQGITIAHELGHRARAFERFLAMVLLTTVSYGHFIIEHNRGHHVHVATVHDPASARLGEPFFAFWWRAVLGGWRSAWQIEAQRLHAAGLSLWSWRNQMLVLSAVPVAITLGLGFTLGAAAAALFVGQSVVAFTMLEIINYIEHYGLSRNEVKAEAAPGRSQGNFERVQPHHSWNSSHMLTNGFLINLQRHSDHHAHSGRPYPILRHHESAPQLPTGYAGMMVLALVPPLWFAVMNPRVAAWRAKYAAP